MRLRAPATGAARTASKNGGGGLQRIGVSETAPTLTSSRPSPSGHKRSDSIANQSAREKNADQQGWCRQLHEWIPAESIVMTV